MFQPVVRNQQISRRVSQLHPPECTYITIQLESYNSVNEAGSPFNPPAGGTGTKPTIMVDSALQPTDFEEARLPAPPRD